MTAWLEGIVDLSHWQSSVNFTEMKQGGVLAVILKATQGSDFIDPEFVSRISQANAAGFLVGAYHFCDSTNINTQANLFLRVAGSLSVLAIDIEENAVPGATVTIPQAAQMVSILQSSTGRVPLCYIGRYGPDGHGTGLPNSVLSRCPLWLPEYGNTPIPPLGWVKPLFWQCTDAGKCEGVGSPCDLSRFFGTQADLISFWHTGVLPS